MITNVNVNMNKGTEVKVGMDASKALMNQLINTKVMVKPTLLDGYYTVTFKGISFIETRHRGNDCMAVQFKLADDKNEYDEIFVLDGAANHEAQQAMLGQIQRYMQQIAEQYNLIGVDITIDELNKHIGEPIDVKVYQKEFTTTKGNTAHARKIGFWRKPVESAPVESTELPKF